MDCRHSNSSRELFRQVSHSPLHMVSSALLTHQSLARQVKSSPMETNEQPMVFTRIIDRRIVCLVLMLDVVCCSSFGISIHGSPQRILNTLLSNTSRTEHFIFPRSCLLHVLHQIQIPQCSFSWQLYLP